MTVCVTGEQIGLTQQELTRVHMIKMQDQADRQPGSLKVLKGILDNGMEHTGSKLVRISWSLGPFVKLEYC